MRGCMLNMLDNVQKVQVQVTVWPNGNYKLSVNPAVNGYLFGIRKG